MAWKTRGTNGTGGSSWSNSDPFNASVINDIDDDFRTWGGNVDAGGYSLTNAAGVTANVLSAIDTGTGSNRLLVSSGQTGTTPRSNVVARLQTTASGRDVAIQLSDNVANAAEVGMVGGALYFCTSGAEKARLDSAGVMGIGTASPSVSSSGKLHVAGDTVRLFPASRTPANSAATGNDGEMCADGSYVYVRSGGSWRRAALSTF